MRLWLKWSYTVKKGIYLKLRYKHNKKWNERTKVLINLMGIFRLHKPVMKMKDKRGISIEIVEC